MNKKKTLEDFGDSFDLDSDEMTEDSAPVIWVHNFTEETASEFAQALRRLEENKQVTTIIVRVDSYGGEIYSLFSMLEAMEACKKPIYTMCSGKAMSAGAVLLSAGDKRYMGKYSTVMVHQARQDDSPGGTTAEVATDARELERLQEIMLNILAKNCGTTKQAIKQLIQQHAGADIFFTAKMALDFGLIDHIGLPRMKKTVKWEVVEE